MELIISLASILVAAAVAAVQIRKFLLERMDSRHQKAAVIVRASAERDSIIIGGAEKAVDLLEKALSRAYADYEHQRVINDRLEAEVTALRTDNNIKAQQIQKLEAEVRELRARVTVVEEGQGKEHGNA